MKQFLVFHPFLFAIFPIVFLFAYNIDEVPATDLILPVLSVIVLTLILLLSLRLITKNYNKIAIITSYFMVLFFSYGRIWELIFSSGIGRIYFFTLLLGSLWALLFLTGAFLVLKSRSNFSGFTKFLNVVAIAAVTISLINISLYEIKPINLAPGEITKEGNGLDSDSPDNLPDIYYILLDGYAREDILKEIYNYDNSEFINYLTNKGFYVASKSRSNYATTRLSLASTLNMEYVNYLSDLPRIEADKQRNKLWVDSKVAQFLKSRGYQYIFVSGGTDIKGMEEHADQYLRYKNVFGLNVYSFMTHLVRTTALLPVASQFNFQNSRAVLYPFYALAAVPHIKGPKFVYAHILCPLPFTFDRNGNPLTEEELRMPWVHYEKRYRDQIIFVNEKVETLVAEILARSDVEPIIILQGDHGPNSTLIENGVNKWAGDYDKLTGAQLDEKLNIFNAYFLPQNGDRLLYDSITPVNSFRIVFNLYFDADYDLLRDESYHSPAAIPYEFNLAPPENDAD